MCPVVVRSYTFTVERIHLTIDGLPRTSVLFLPPTAVRGHRPPLVIFLHGAGGSGEWADGETGWSALAAREGFVLALPDALPPHIDQVAKFLTNPRRWNDGSLGPTGEPSTADDVAFLKALIDEATRRANVDTRRVYLSGFSNGTGMVFRAAAELADRLAGIAAVAGYCHVSDPRPVRPVPTLYLIGDSDPLVPIRGGDIRSPWLNRLVRRSPVADTLTRWAVAIDAHPMPLVEQDHDGLRIDVYPGPVEYRSIVVAGLGHHWPGGKGQLNHKIGGSPSNRLDATSQIWRFFQRQER